MDATANPHPIVSFQLVVSVVAFLAAFAGVLSSFLARRRILGTRIKDSGISLKVPDSKGPKDKETEFHPPVWSKTRDAASPALVARSRVAARMGEAAVVREGELRTQKWSRRAANLLTITQYIIGGVLASSFVQESLTPKWVGALGVLVLIASLFKEQFHPELNAADAKKRASKLQALTRSSEDQLAILDAKLAGGQDHSDAMIALLKQITERLTEIENPESVELKPQPTAK